jgi:hypothetical protein
MEKKNHTKAFISIAKKNKLQAKKGNHRQFYFFRDSNAKPAPFSRATLLGIFDLLINLILLNAF